MVPVKLSQDSSGLFALELREPTARIDDIGQPRLYLRWLPNAKEGTSYFHMAGYYVVR